MTELYTKEKFKISEPDAIGIFKCSSVVAPRRPVYFTGTRMISQSVVRPDGTYAGVCAQSGAIGDMLTVYRNGVYVCHASGAIQAGELIIPTGVEAAAAFIRAAKTTVIAVSGAVYSTFFTTGVIPVGVACELFADGDNGPFLLW